MSRFGILNPAGAMTLVAVAVLIALYLYNRRRRVILVASLFLWRQLPAQEIERQRFRPDALFLLQLALLLALIGGYLRPYLERASGAVAGTSLLLVVDVSASMQAREDAGTRFELARQRAARRLADLASGDEVMIVAAAERPRIALRWTADEARVRQSLETLEPVDTPTNLAPALELALEEASVRPGARIAVFTDLPPEASGVGPDALASMDYVQIGRNDDNLAVASLTVSRPPFGGRDETTAAVVVRNYGRTTRRATLEARVGAALWARRDLVLAPRASEHVLLAHPPADGILTIVLDADDALALDNRAVGWIGPPEPLNLLLVSDSRELASAFAEIAGAIAGSRVEVMTRARYEERPPEGRRLALFDGFVPSSTPPAVNALYVAPPAGNTLCPSAGVQEQATVIDWEPDHPALSGLTTLQAVAADRTSQLLPPEWGTPVVLAASRTIAYPLLIAGEHDGRRVACLGAELSGPLASSDRLPLLVLTLGTLRWLAEPYGNQALMVTTGLPVLAGRGPTEPVSGVGLRVAGDPPVLLAERAGLFRLGPQGADRLVLANLFDDRESDIGRDGGGEWRATVERSAAPRAGVRREIGWWLYLVAGALLAIEWLAWQRRSRGT